MFYFYGGSSTLNLTLMQKRWVETSDLFYYRHTDIKDPPCAFISFYSGLIPITTRRERKSPGGWNSWWWGERKERCPSTWSMRNRPQLSNRKAMENKMLEGLDTLPDFVFISDVQQIKISWIRSRRKEAYYTYFKELNNIHVYQTTISYSVYSLCLCIIHKVLSTSYLKQN